MKLKIQINNTRIEVKGTGCAILGNVILPILELQKGILELETPEETSIIVMYKSQKIADCVVAEVKRHIAFFTRVINFDSVIYSNVTEDTIVVCGERLVDNFNYAKVDKDKDLQLLVPIIDGSMIDATVVLDDQDKELIYSKIRSIGFERANMITTSFGEFEVGYHSDEATMLSCIVKPKDNDNIPKIEKELCKIIGVKSLLMLIDDNEEEGDTDGE